MEEKQLYTRAEAAKILFVEPCTLRRLCNKYFKELQALGYRKRTTFIKKACVDFLKEKRPLTNPLINIVDKLSKSKIAEKMGVSGQYLSKLLHTGILYEKLKELKYSKYQKELTLEQYNVANEMLVID